MHVIFCLFGALTCRASALQMSIIISYYYYQMYSTVAVWSVDVIYLFVSELSFVIAK